MDTQLPVSAGKLLVGVEKIPVGSLSQDDLLFMTTTKLRQNTSRLVHLRGFVKWDDWMNSTVPGSKWPYTVHTETKLEIFEEARVNSNYRVALLSELPHANEDGLKHKVRNISCRLYIDREGNLWKAYQEFANEWQGRNIIKHTVKFIVEEVELSKLPLCASVAVRNSELMRPLGLEIIHGLKLILAENARQVRQHADELDQSVSEIDRIFAMIDSN